MALGTRLKGTSRSQAGSGQGPRKARATTRAKPLILCVDDEQDALTILRLFLSAHGFAITVASSATEALRLVADRHPDLIITDYAMPDMNGLDLCRALRGSGETHDIPIILHSGVDLREDHADLFDHFLLKPAELELLAREIRSLLPAAHAQKSA
ncbi:MAG TPA: response regulator [Steroidobacteraceae bacterium]|nr:response regulator [Steroidobacteraceae bacterium]